VVSVGRFIQVSHPLPQVPHPRLPDLARAVRLETPTLYAREQELGTPYLSRSASVEDSAPTMVENRRPRISVIVPALNEARNLPYVLKRIPAVDEVILVDGGSVDDTIAVARSEMPDIVVVTQGRRGKGNALACGFAAASGDIIVMIDADGSTDPAEIPFFVEALVNGADFAKGSRYLKSGGSADLTKIRSFGNRGLNFLVNRLFSTRFSDLCYGYNAFWRYCLPVFELDATSPRPAGDGRLWGDGFEIETLLNLRVSRTGLEVVEVPSFEAERIHGESNLNAVRDGLRVLRTVGREFFGRTSPQALAAAVELKREMRSSAVGPRDARHGARHRAAVGAEASSR
jgi:glycosyl transferase family 2